MGRNKSKKNENNITKISGKKKKEKRKTRVMLFAVRAEYTFDLTTYKKTVHTQ